MEILVTLAPMPKPERNGAKTEHTSEGPLHLLYRGDVFLWVVGLLFAAFGIALDTDWFPHSLLVAQILISFIGFLAVSALWRHAHKNRGERGKLAVFVGLSVVVFIAVVVVGIVIQDRKGSLEDPKASAMIVTNIEFGIWPVGSSRNVNVYFENLGSPVTYRVEGALIVEDVYHQSGRTDPQPIVLPEMERDAWKAFEKGQDVNRFAPSPAIPYRSTYITLNRLAPVTQDDWQPWRKFVFTFAVGKLEWKYENSSKWYVNEFCAFSTNDNQTVSHQCKFHNGPPKS